MFYSHYSDVEKTPLFVFGHGLSYTSFEYSNVTVTNTYETNSEITVAFDLKNVGQVKGKEVAQLYIRDLVGSVTRPIKELKGFELVELEAGETKKISIKLTSKELGFYNNEQQFKVESGDFKIFIGGSSETILEANFKIE